ncbi:hypothetical protein CPB83DRAFT_755298 [Crepidotus variabilis]|uniref:Thioesterase domain-containing protein n=1 Tax=Crepidotus variabilis TaxID=179855 RepID=A0A9P6ESM9_9AGAR|nr:hypothetical protein CPB83DRAFT_755298 [Crepidotus variabilis]
MTTELSTTSLKSLPPALAAVVKSWVDQNGISTELESVKGNAPRDTIRACLSVFRYMASTEDRSYGAAVGRRLKMAEIKIKFSEAGSSNLPAGRAVSAQTTCEILVYKDMCNVFGTLHGGCAAYMTDICSTSSIVALGIVNGVDATGVSQAMNLIWHKAVKTGAKLRIVSNTISQEGRIRVCRCEVRSGSEFDASLTDQGIKDVGWR